MIPSDGALSFRCMLNIIACPRTWEYSIIFPAYISCVLYNDLYGMLYFLDIAEKTVPVFLVITGKPED